MSTSPAAIIAMLLATAPAWAQGSPDPHMSVGQLSGSFTLHSYGTLADGTVCPPSPNNLNFALEQNGKLTYAHGVGVDSAADPALASAFTESGHCALSFTGAAIVRMHHGTQITILPASVQPLAANAGGNGHAGPIEGSPYFSGKFSIEYAPFMCLVPPCPPGNFIITDANGGDITTVKEVVYVSDDGHVVPHPGGDSAEGRIWLEDDGLRARIQVDRAVEGLWK